ncbi:hypothetical protein [Micromonospora sp. NPDC047730]|uniref:hypothetical protein n=1 Tax=Micromonospora sp. NPDC047730 TaxID=3364253 RepID=UPI00371068FE
MRPEQARALPQRRPWDVIPSAEAKWSKHSGRHQSCGECVLRRHHGDTSAAPNAARYKRTVGDGVQFFCSGHGMARRENDDDAKLAKKIAAAGGRTR